MRFAAIALASIMAAGPAIAPAVAEDDTSLDTVIVRAPEFTLRSLLPKDLDARLEDGFSKRVAGTFALLNGTDGSFQADFELMDGAFPNVVIYTLFVSQEPMMMKLLADIDATASSPGTALSDTNFPAERPCVGMRDQALITCRIGKGGVQISAASATGEPADYDLVKAAVLDLDSLAYNAVLAGQ